MSWLSALAAGWDLILLARFHLTGCSGSQGSIKSFGTHGLGMVLVRKCIPHPSFWILYLFKQVTPHSASRRKKSLMDAPHLHPMATPPGLVLGCPTTTSIAVQNPGCSLGMAALGLAGCFTGSHQPVPVLEIPAEKAETGWSPTGGN